MPLAGTRRDADVTTRREGVGVRRAFARQIGQEAQSAAARRSGARFGHHQIVGIATGGLRDRIFRVADRVLQPLQRTAGAQRHAHVVPLPGNGVAECVRAAHWVGHRLIGVHEHHAAGADRDVGDAAFDDARADRARRAIPRAAYDWRARHQRAAQGRRRGSADLRTGNNAFVTRRQKPRIQSQFREHFRRPFSVAHIQQQCARRVRDFRGKFAGQLKTDEIFRQQRLDGLFEAARFIFAHPQNLRRGEPRQRGIADQLQQTCGTAHAIVDLRAFRRGALIIPQNGRPQDGVLLIQQNEAVHLPREAHAFDFAGRDTCGFNGRRNRRQNGAPPFHRRLFAP